MKVTGSSPGDALGASGQLNNVETAERWPGHGCGGPGRMRSTQEATRLLATVRDRSPAATYVPILFGGRERPTACRAQIGEICAVDRTDRRSVVAIDERVSWHRP